MAKDLTKSKQRKNKKRTRSGENKRMDKGTKKKRKKSN